MVRGRKRAPRHVSKMGILHQVVRDQLVNKLSVEWLTVSFSGNDEIFPIMNSRDNIGSHFGERFFSIIVIVD